MIGGLVLAAGAGSRFGGAKQLAELDGSPLLEWPLRAVAASPVERTVLVLGSDAGAIAARLDLHGAQVAVCERWEEGLSASLATGLGALADAEAVVIALGDQPRLAPEAIERVIAARAPGIHAVRATYAGAPGHPVLLERELFERARGLDGDRGARELLEGATTLELPCDDLGGGADVDTREELEKLRAGGASR